MKKLWITLVVIIVLAIVAYGGYKVMHHFTKQQPPMQTATTQPSASPTSAMMQNDVYKMASAGGYFTDVKGMTLYIYSKDTTGVSNCSGQCLVNWPAYVAPSKTGNFPTDISVITRTDGTLQYAWKGMPLYYFIGDKKAGDATGNGVGGFSFAK